MLDEKDLLALSKLIDEKITASEERMTAHMSKEIAASEERMTAHMNKEIAASEERTFHKASVMMESYFEPKFSLLAENQKIMMETLVPKSRVEEIEDELALLRSVVQLHSEQIAELKKA